MQVGPAGTYWCTLPRQPRNYYRLVIGCHISWPPIGLPVSEIPDDRSDLRAHRPFEPPDGVGQLGGQPQPPL